jgi:hypothetical protein
MLDIEKTPTSVVIEGKTGMSLEQSLSPHSSQPPEQSLGKPPSQTIASPPLAKTNNTIDEDSNQLKGHPNALVLVSNEGGQSQSSSGRSSAGEVTGHANNLESRTKTVAGYEETNQEPSQILPSSYLLFAEGHPTTSIRGATTIQQLSMFLPTATVTNNCRVRMERPDWTKFITSPCVSGIIFKWIKK